MRAIDTNVVVRLIARDDREDEYIARKLLDEPFLLLPTIMLESEWALRSVYRTPRATIVKGLALLLGHEMAAVRNVEALCWALDRYAAGADFADMLHVALAGEAKATSFATFDRGIAKAVDDIPLAIETLA